MARKKQLLSLLLSAAISTACLTVGSYPAFAEVQTPDTPVHIQMQGDANNDGSVDSYDSLLVLRQSVGYNDISEENLPYCDLDNDNELTSVDALLILMKSVNSDTGEILCETGINAICGDTVKIDAKIVPENKNSKVTFKFIPDKTISKDGSGQTVLEVSNTGRIKAYHPGTSTVTIKASNGATAQCKVTVQDLTTQQTITAAGKNLTVNKRMMMKNECYDYTYDFEKIDGIVVHSTATPGVMAETWYSAWNKPNIEACVHAFLDDKGVCQYLPLEQIAWHAGSPANKTYLDFEICEPAGFYYSNNSITNYNVAAQQKYFDKIWTNATVYTAYLCKTYNLTSKNVISHAEAGKMKIGTNHGDPDHWFVLHGRNMNDFRKDVQAILDSGAISATEPKVVKNIPLASASTSTSDYFDIHTEVTPFDMFKVWGDDSLRY